MGQSSIIKGNKLWERKKNIELDGKRELFDFKDQS